MVTWPSFMASSRADCGFGVVRLISSASRTLAKMETRARRRTSSLPRMTRRKLFSSSAARRAVATRVSGAIELDSTMRARRLLSYLCHERRLNFADLAFAQVEQQRQAKRDSYSKNSDQGQPAKKPFQTFASGKDEKRNRGDQHVHTEERSDAIGEELLDKQPQVKAVRDDPGHKLPVGQDYAENAEDEIYRLPVHKPPCGWPPDRISNENLVDRNQPVFRLTARFVSRSEDGLRTSCQSSFPLRRAQ